MNPPRPTLAGSRKDLKDDDTSPRFGYRPLLLG